MSARTPFPWWRSPAPPDRCTPHSLRMKTRNHWNEGSPNPEEELMAVRSYIRDLLPFELTYTEEIDKHNLQQIPCDTLALLVGYSFDPLLQVISVLQPQRIVLVLNHWYGSVSSEHRQEGKVRGKDFRELVLKNLAPFISKHLPEGSASYAPKIHDDDICMLPDTSERNPALPHDLPGEVFKVLADRLIGDLRERKKVIVDVTGGKKSMDAGAFLFAAYADALISYVDFEDYDVEKRRPLGYTCKIRPLDNPYRAYRLHDWEQVQVNYEKHHFARAGEALRSFRQEACEPRFTREQIAALEQLQTVLRLYELWDSGDFRQAKAEWNQQQGKVAELARPLAVERLGARWPFAADGLDAERAAQELKEAHDRLRTESPSFFCANSLLLSYAQDELARARRLSETNEDQRSALLRAAGLDELLLKARWVRLLLSRTKEGIDIYDGYDQPKQLSSGARAVVFDRLLNHNDVDSMGRALGSGREKTESEWPFLKINFKPVELRLRARAGTRVLARYANEVKLLPETLRELRNRAIHTYLYVPEPVARAALDYAEANLADFEQGWTDLACDRESPALSRKTVPGRLEWHELCDLLKLEFLPPVLVR